MSTKLSFREQLCYITVRICGFDAEGNSHTGTGFFYNFFKYDNEGNQKERIPAFITNRHVIEGCDKIEFSIPTVLESCRTKHVDDIEIQDLSFGTIQITDSSLDEIVIWHPDASVDLCVVDLSGVLTGLITEAKILPFFKAFDEAFILKQKESFEELDAVEEIIMIGYPNGLWDEKNNLPIFRRGITATHPAVDYNGMKEFLIDAACFPGSSGSPVFLYDQVETSSKKDKDKKQFREILLGILYGGEIMDVEGEMKTVEIPTKKVTRPVLETMLNLGCVIKAERILDFEELIWSRFNDKYPESK